MASPALNQSGGYCYSPLSLFLCGTWRSSFLWSAREDLWIFYLREFFGKILVGGGIDVAEFWQGDSGGGLWLGIKGGSLFPVSLSCLSLSLSSLCLFYFMEAEMKYGSLLAAPTAAAIRSA